MNNRYYAAARMAPPHAAAADRQPLDLAAASCILPFVLEEYVGIPELSGQTAVRWPSITASEQSHCRRDEDVKPVHRSAGNCQQYGLATIV